ncbi:MAG TPA: endonuclease III [Chloroflexota bacterium]|nr:endonuclease III [Chloroflexota bacterium]
MSQPRNDGTYAPRSALLANPRRHIEAVDRALRATYGTPILRPDHDPLGGLIATILSQSTSDTNSERAYASLRARFPSWEAVRAAPSEDIADAIRSGGLARSKSARIKDILDTLVERYGALSLERLSAMSIPEARAELSSLHGVGAKTASCVLLFNLGKPAFPVDTHVHRLSRRIGFAAPRATPARVQDLVEASLAPARRYAFHINLIRHGRGICKAQRPRCDDCPIRQICRFGMALPLDGDQR